MWSVPTGSLCFSRGDRKKKKKEINGQRKQLKTGIVAVEEKRGTEKEVRGSFSARVVTDGVSEVTGVKT